MKKLTLTASILFCSLFLFAEPGIPDEKAIGHYNNGMEFYNNNDYKSAIKEFSQAIAISSGYTDAYIGRGNSYDNTNDPDNALQDYITASSLDEKYAIFAYGYECVLLKRYDAAILALSESINKNINSYIAYCMRGNSYLGKEQYDKAIESYSEGIKLDPDCFQAYFSRGAAYIAKNNFDTAIQNLEKAAELCPDYYMTFYFLGILYRIQGDTKKSEEMMNIYNNLNPESHI